MIAPKSMAPYAVVVPWFERPADEPNQCEIRTGGIVFDLHSIPDTKGRTFYVGRTLDGVDLGPLRRNMTSAIRDLRRLAILGHVPPDPESEYAIDVQVRPRAEGKASP